MILLCLLREGLHTYGKEAGEKFITGVDSDVVRSTESGNARASMSGMNNR